MQYSSSSYCQQPKFRFGLFSSGRAKVVKLYVSEKTLQELEDVLNRDYIKERFKFTDEVIKEFLEKLRNVAVVLKNVPKVFSLTRDVDDEEWLCTKSRKF